jgi:hypothetical protein
MIMAVVHIHKKGGGKEGGREGGREGMSFSPFFGALSSLLLGWAVI